MGAAAVLLVGLLINPRPVRMLSTLALPLAVSGLGIAVFHVNLEMTGKLECPLGLLNLGTAPQQSLGLFLVVVGVLLGGTWTEPVGRVAKPWTIAGTILLGSAMAAASVWSAPPLPAAPAQPYAEPLTICRPPYVTD